MDERLSITVIIDGQKYPMNIKRSEEEIIRRAAQQINDRLVMYRQRFASQKKQPFDFFAMVCLDFATRYLNSENASDDTEFMSELQILSGEIDDYIQKSNVL